METENLKQYDYASLYEDWHIQEEKAANDITSTGSNVGGEGASVYAKALAARAGKIGTLQCAIQNKSPSENPRFLQALVERLELEDDGRRPIPLPNYVVQPQQKLEHKPLGPAHVNVSIDAFFEEYPECVRSDWDDIGEEDSSSESSDEDDDVEKSRSKKRPLSAATTNIFPTNVPNSTQTSEVTAPPCILYPSQNYCKEKHMNPAIHQSRSYPVQHVQHHPHNSNQQPHLPPTNPRQQHSFPPPFSHNPVQPNSELNKRANYAPSHDNDDDGWDDPPNPFQTAREYAGVVGDQAASKQHQQRYNPYRDQPQQEEEVVTLPQGPPIRESLKRKFQVPKLGAAQKNDSKETVGSKSSANVNEKKSKSQAITSTSSNSKTSNNTDEADEDELPEELKKFGKELVAKIESEIMDKGERVTFKDIAGLEDAKETIQEIVCWPMLV